MMALKRYSDKPKMNEALHLLGNCIAAIAEDLDAEDLPKLRKWYDQVRKFKDLKAFHNITDLLNNRCWQTGARFITVAYFDKWQGNTYEVRMKAVDKKGTEPMLSWKATEKRYAKVYAYKRCIWSVQCADISQAEETAKWMVKRLEDGDLDAAIKVAVWALTHASKDRLNICLGPHFSLRISDRTIYNMDNGPVVQI